MSCKGPCTARVSHPPLERAGDDVRPDNTSHEQWAIKASSEPAALTPPSICVPAMSTQPKEKEDLCGVQKRPHFRCTVARVRVVGVHPERPNEHTLSSDRNRTGDPAAQDAAWAMIERAFGYVRPLACRPAATGTVSEHASRAAWAGWACGRGDG